MKHILTLVFLLIVTSALYAQNLKVSPAYWVVETNIHQRNYSIVRLYDLSNKLVHEVRMDDVYFDVTRPRHRKMLNQLLKGSYQRAEITAKRIQKDSRRKSIG